MGMIWTWIANDRLIHISHNIRQLKHVFSNLNRPSHIGKHASNISNRSAIGKPLQPKRPMEVQHFCHILERLPGTTRGNVRQLKKETLKNAEGMGLKMTRPDCNAAIQLLWRDLPGTLQQKWPSYLGSCHNNTHLGPIHLSQRNQ